MAILNIVKYGKTSHILRKKTQPVKEINKEIHKLVDDMIETMYSAPGVGLAANQVGKNLSILVIDITQQKKSPIVLFNPCITEKKGKFIAEEGCLSFPGLLIPIKRAVKIKVKALNRKGEPILIEAEGLLSKVLQHEIDHLEGKTMLDRLPLLKRLKTKLFYRNLCNRPVS